MIIKNNTNPTMPQKLPDAAGTALAPSNAKTRTAKISICRIH